MERQKRWQLYLIISVLLITLYNVLPTVFFYSKPLKEPVGLEQSHQVAGQIVDRIDVLEPQSVEWLESFAKLLQVHPNAITLRESDPRFIDVTFTNAADAQRFKAVLPEAGKRIPFLPAQLRLGKEVASDQGTTIVVERRIGVHLDQTDIDQLFQFTTRFDAQGTPTPLYKALVIDRVAHLAAAVGGTSPKAQEAELVAKGELTPEQQDVLLSFAQDIVDAKKALVGPTEAIFKRIAHTVSQTTNLPEGGMTKALAAQMQSVSTKISAKRQELSGKDGKTASLDGETRERVALYDQQIAFLAQAATILQQNQADFDAVQKPLTADAVAKSFEDGALPYNATTRQQVIDLGGRNPYIQSIVVDWDANLISLVLYPDINTLVNTVPNSDEQAFLKDKITSFLINDLARISQASDETLAPRPDGYAVNLSTLTDSHSLMAFNLGSLAKKESEQIQNLLAGSWNPKHPDLVRANFPIEGYEAFKKLPEQEQRLGLVVYAPVLSPEAPPEGFVTDGIYVIAKGLQDIIQKYRDVPSAEGAQALITDFNALVTVLEQRGFMHYPGNSWGIAPEYKHDYIFRLPNYYDALVKATREDFSVKGSKRFAVLDYTDVEQRILTLNRIEDKIHEDLLKWRDEYHTAQVDLDPVNRLFVPAPTKNVFVDNFELSGRKYFRGDDSKILKWGLDLSGGKTVRIGLTDQNGRPVTKPEDLNQAVNELYTRINKMGVAERSIRVEGENIILDFPGSQGLSASELVKASTMTFHIVNEKFGPPSRDARNNENKDLFNASDRFLQDVWNEAVVTNRKDIDSINSIAWKHLGGDMLGGQIRPRSEQARLLYQNGLRLGNPDEKSVSGAFDDAVSSIAVRSGDDYNAWQGYTHPLMFVFRNYALEGSSLSNVQVGYDPSEGNMLSFEVKSSYDGQHRSGNPRDDFYAWTSQFAKEEVAGTSKEKYTNGSGWRMAVILNDRIISSPTLQAALSAQARITGRFTQREVNQLAADLKAGSLSFTPRILSEENISPDLGLEERTKGMVAFGIAILCVVIMMCGYYRFAGLVACVAVLFNLLIMWGVLQNIGAALTLPGIAGLVLTIGMAVDANVLVFERFREEFQISGRLGSALSAGYRKAFSAIVDSNLTTIIAALILTQFDSGPIKGFATVIIIGIASSMFTGLFMTRFFFAGWVQDPKHKNLTMSHWIGNTKIDFLSYAKTAFITFGVLCVASLYLLYAERNTIMGMDFTGGYSLTVELQEKKDVDSYRLLAKQALERQGIAAKDVQVKQLSRPNQIKIQIGMGVEEAGGVFHGLPLELSNEGKYEYQYEKNPRIVWVTHALKEAGLEVRHADLDQLYNRWTVMSGQFSDAMRYNALWALCLALAAILIYITLRFEFKYAIAAVVGLVNDVIVSLGVLAVAHVMGFSVQIDLEIMGAVMAILGYSLNDIIIVFDRIREDVRVLRKMKFRDMVNHALNITLSRTLMTSSTTLVVLLCMLLFGGSSIFGFSLVMTVGVIVGTISSLFISSPIMLYFHDREEQQQQEEYKLRKA